MKGIELQLNLAEADAKLKALENFESGSQTEPAMFPPQSQSTGMIDYLKYYRAKSDASVYSEPCPVKFTEIGTIPRTPLQMTQMTLSPSLIYS